MAKRIIDKLRLPQGPVDLASIPTDATPGFKGNKVEGQKAMTTLAPVLGDLQEKLYAEGRTGGTRRLLLVLQGMDTSGKGGVLRHVAGLCDPQGLHIKAFKAPTAEERGHDFLWRIRRELPPAGFVGAFDRSHYEDVLIVRVHNLVPRATWSRRYATINRFEEQLAAKDTTVVKCFLHISKEEQRARLLARLDDPTKYWKYNPADVDERASWDDYQEAYAVALEKCNTDAAPWHVIPADRKWYRNWAITNVLIEHLQELDPKWPAATYDVEGEKARLTES